MLRRACSFDAAVKQDGRGRSLVWWWQVSLYNRLAGRYAPGVVKHLSYMLAFIAASVAVHAGLFVALRSPAPRQLARVVPAEPRPAPAPQKKTEAPPPAEEQPMQPTIVPPRVVHPRPERIAESAPTFVYGAALRVKSAP